MPRGDVRTPEQEALRAAGKCGAKRKPHLEQIKGGIKIADAEDPDGTYYCTLVAGWGTDHKGIGPCRYHMGNTKSVKTRVQAEQAELEVRRYGLPRDVPPAQALLEEVHRSAGIVAYLDALVGDLDQDELKQYTEGDGKIWEKPSVWWEMYSRERKHLVQACESAIRCGVAQAMVQLAQEQGALLATAIRGILADLDLADDPRVPQVVRKHLTLVAAS